MVLRSQYYDDVYFSAQDGLAETRYVFLDGNNLSHRWQESNFQGDEFVIAETGFGTGLNFLASWDLFKSVAPRGKKMRFVSVEKHPLSKDEIRQALAPWADELSVILSQYLDAYPDDVSGDFSLCFDGENVILNVLIGDAAHRYSEANFKADAWFFDGFRPSTNPDMWTQDLFNATNRLCNKSASFSSFTAAGFVRRGLAEAGFSVQKQKGFGRKREMIVGQVQ